MYEAHILYIQYLEEYDVIFSLLFRQCLGCGLAGKGHSHLETVEKEPYLLPTWILEGGVERDGGEGEGGVGEAGRR